MYFCIYNLQIGVLDILMDAGNWLDRRIVYQYLNKYGAFISIRCIFLNLKLIKMCYMAMQAEYVCKRAMILYGRPWSCVQPFTASVFFCTFLHIYIIFCYYATEGKRWGYCSYGKKNWFLCCSIFWISFDIFSVF